MLALTLCQHILATLLGKKKKDKGSATMKDLPNPSEVDPNNIARPTVDELSAEDCQAYEDFMKEREEENIRRKAKEDEKIR